MCVDNFLYRHVYHRFGDHGNVGILVDPKVFFGILNSRGVNEELSKRANFNMVNKQTQHYPQNLSFKVTSPCFQIEKNSSHVYCIVFASQSTIIKHFDWSVISAARI